jgi:microcystin-dependent protein
MEQYTDFIGFLTVFAGTYIPKGWMACEGQLLPIAQNQALYSILGTRYGGDGKVNFALPDMRGRAPMHYCNTPAPGMANAYPLAAAGGEETVTLTVNQMPIHSHALNVANTNATEHVPGTNGAYAIAAPMDASLNDMLGFNNTNNTDLVSMTGSMTSSVGGNEPHNNMQPFVALTYIICLEGYYPSHN